MCHQLVGHPPLAEMLLIDYLGIEANALERGKVGQSGRIIFHYLLKGAGEVGRLEIH